MLPITTNYGPTLTQENLAILCLYAAHQRDLLRQRGRQLDQIANALNEPMTIYTNHAEEAETQQNLLVFRYRDGAALHLNWNTSPRMSVDENSPSVVTVDVGGVEIGIAGTPGLEGRLYRLIEVARKFCDNAAHRNHSDNNVNIIMSDFSRAAIKGRIKRSTRVKEDGFYISIPHRPEVNLSSPAFDFGNLSDALNLSPEMTHEFTYGTATGLPLPFAECFFVTTSTPAASTADDQYELEHVYYLVADDAGQVTARSFYRVKGKPSDWVAQPWCHFWGDGRTETKFDAIPGIENEKVQRVLEILAVAERCQISEAAWVLTQPKVIRERVGQNVHIPKSLTIGKKHRANPPPAVVIRCDADQLLRAVRSRSISHSQKSAHDRRGHFRRLRDGRIIQVRPCKIHGGSEAQRFYVVKT